MLSTLRLSSCDVDLAIGVPGCIPGFENRAGYFRCVWLRQPASRLPGVLLLKQSATISVVITSTESPHGPIYKGQSLCRQNRLTL